MPAWLTGKLITYGLAALVCAGISWKLYSVVKNHFIDVKNVQTELSNERILRERAQASYRSLELTIQLEDRHRQAMADIRAKYEAEIAAITVRTDEQIAVLEDRERLARLTAQRPQTLERLANRATKARFDEMEGLINHLPAD